MIRKDGTGPALLVLPEPQFRADVEWLQCDDLTQSFTVLVPDLMYSAHPLESLAQTHLECARVLGVTRMALLAPSGSGALAHIMKVMDPDLVDVICLISPTDGQALPSLSQGDLILQPNGSHLVDAWHLVRDADLFPTGNPPPARFEADHPGLDRLHRRTLDLVRPFTRATSPTESPTEIASDSRDSGHVHLVQGAPHTPPWPAHRSADVALALAEWSLRAPVAPATRERLSVMDEGPGLRSLSVPTDHGHVHVRVQGNSTHPPLLFLHGSPGSAESFAPTIEALSRDHLVVAPDCPGNGLSTPLTDPRPSMQMLAETIAPALEVLGLRPILTYGIHTGASLALEIAAIDPQLIGTVVANGLPNFSVEEREDLDRNYFADITPDRHGTHLLRAWHLMRDVSLYWPWYGTRADQARPTMPPPPATLHRLTMEFLQSGPSYAAAYRAAFHHDPDRVLSRIAARVAICATPTDPLRPGSEKLASRQGREFFELASPSPHHVRELIAKVLEHTES